MCMNNTYLFVCRLLPTGYRQKSSQDRPLLETYEKIQWFGVRGRTPKLNLRPVSANIEPIDWILEGF